MKVRINALPDEAAELILWLTEHKNELRIVSCSDAYPETPRTKRCGTILTSDLRTQGRQS